MAQQPGWIILYDILDDNQTPPPGLVQECLSSRTGIGETMLHWYAIEGSPKVLASLINLGFDVNPQNNFGNTPLMEASQIGRWENIKVLLDHGASFDCTNTDGEDYWTYLQDFDVTIPEWVFNYGVDAKSRKEPSIDS